MVQHQDFRVSDLSHMAYSTLYSIMPILMLPRLQQFSVEKKMKGISSILILMSICHLFFNEISWLPQL